MIQNQDNWSILFSGFATMTLWCMLCYVTWHGLGTHATPDGIKRAQIINICVSIVFTLMILTIVFSSKDTPFPILLPMGMLIVPLFINIRALERRKFWGDLKNPGLSHQQVGTATGPFIPPIDITLRLEPSAHYLVRHWQGDLPLPQAFWINGVLVAGLSTILLSSLVSLMNNGDHSLRILSFINLGALLFLALGWVWTCVGIWRSAERFTVQGGSSKWRNVLQCAVILGIIFMSGPFSNSFLPQLKECALIASGQDPLGNIHITVSANKNTLIVNGKLREGSASEIQRMIDMTPGVRSVMLNSGGGRVLEAKQLARTVQTRKLDTYVEGQCTSACTYVFLAGKNRAASPNAQIGFHQPSFPGIGAQTQRAITGDMLTVYRTAGLPEKFITKIGAVPPDDMWYPTRDELIESHVITHVSLDGEADTYASTM